MGMATMPSPSALGLTSMSGPTYLGLATMLGARPRRGLA